LDDKMKKQSNPMPPDISKKPPPPPAPPPCRTFRDIPFVGLVEIKESKLKTRDWENYMRGYRDGRNA